MARLHIIDDEVDLHDLLKDYFADTPFELTGSETPHEGIEFVKKNQVDLVILDLMLPGMDGFEVCRKLRETHPYLPIIMLTAKKDDFNKIVGLELGADDYIAKPFNPRELEARIKTVLRRFERSVAFNEKKENMLYSKTWDITLNLDSRQVKRAEQPLNFTTTEFEFLKCLMENAGVVQSRDALMNKVKGIEFESFDRSIDVFVSKLRQKLEDKGEIIKTVRGIGYIFSKL